VGAIDVPFEAVRSEHNRGPEFDQLCLVRRPVLTERFIENRAQYLVFADAAIKYLNQILN
jgi:hypothetical protein